MTISVYCHQYLYIYIYSLYVYIPSISGKILLARCSPLIMQNKSSDQMCSIKKGVLENYAKSWKPLQNTSWKYQKTKNILTFLGVIEACNFMKKRIQNRCSANYTKFFRTFFLQNTSGWLVLTVANIWSCTANVLS